VSEKVHVDDNPFTQQNNSERDELAQQLHDEAKEIAR